ncbi:MAG TPA: NAD(P)-binding protein, partial [Candidatus Limnocylindrales bacterium]
MAKTTNPGSRAAAVSGGRAASPSNGHSGANGTDSATNQPDRRASERTYDAIVIGGGHNGLVNGAYLAKSGLKTLILERRHLVGGAAITEELRPGFWFTTFSYALSLLRPDIIHDLELTKHGFMPLLMPSTF